MAEPPTLPPREGTDTTQAGEGLTSAHYDGSVGPTLVPAGAAAAAVVLPPPGYAIGAPIGRGGMGEVLSATDLRIGREVAVKRMISEKPDGDQVARFLREARIQARLEHPAIVPVHELGVDESGRPFFTMKKLAGKTLGEKQDQGTALNSLLRAFADVCLAVDFAHSRGVVHRDLKPSNIMLGDYGEVYVIDWGIARVLADERDTPSPQQGDIATLDDGSTKSGALLGTPGFMSPEQIRGARATPPADVYALGAILFEILTGEALHKRGQAGIATTLSTPQVSPSARRPERNIAPELDAACFDALAEMPEDRPTARALAEQVQRFLDGDRDLERRRQLARAQVKSAMEVLETDADDARASAMRRAGRALALDPENEEAASVVGALLIEPPVKVPPDLAARLDEDERVGSSARAHKGMLAYLSIFGVLPLTLVVDIKNWALVVGFYAIVIVGALYALQSSRTGRPVPLVVMLVNLALAVVFTRVAGPFILTPVMICCALVAMSPVAWINRRTWPIVTWTAAAVLLPVVLEWLNVLPQTWAIGEGKMVIVSDLVVTHGRLDELALIGTNLLFTMVVALILLTVNRERRANQRQLFVQAWHLRQLLPSVKRAWATRPNA